MRGRSFLFLGGAGLALGLLSQLDRLWPIAGAAVTVLGSVVLAVLAHGGPASQAVAMGAGGALAYEGAGPYLPLVATGLWLTIVFGTCAMRSRSWRELAFHLSVAFACGVAASWVARANAGLETSLWMVAVMVAALLASAPWLIPADAPHAYALRALASRARGPLRERLLRAVVTHRRLADLDLSAPLRRRIQHAFDQLRDRCEQRLRRRAFDRIDPGVAQTVDQLVRVARAAVDRAPCGRR